MIQGDWNREDQDCVLLDDMPWQAPSEATVVEIRERIREATKNWWRPG